MSYQVIAPCVIAKQQGELGNREFYQGGVIPWLSDEQAEHFLSEGLVVEIKDSVPVVIVDDDDVADVDDVTEGDAVPLRAASKADWVAYAISLGADPDEAEATNKADLIELYGG